VKDLLAILTLANIGIGLALLGWRGRERVTICLARAASLALAFLAVLLLWQVDRGLGTSWSWVPGIEPVSLDLSATGVYLVVMTTGSLVLTLHELIERPRPQSGLASRLGLAYLLCGFVVAALTVNQFLVRYALLEVIILCGLFIFVVEMEPRSGNLRFWRRYLQFRASDVALLLGILWLYHSTGTFVIKEMVAGASALTSAQRLPILLGGTLAAWVKLGLPPLHGWLLDSAALTRGTQAWVAGTAWPVLGAYLMYRLAPLTEGVEPIRAFWLISGVLILSVALYKSIRSPQIAERTSWGLAAHGAIMPILVGTPAMMPYLLTFIPIRAGLCLLRPRKEGRELQPFAMNPRALASEPDSWALVLAQWAAAIEGLVLEGANRRTARLILQLGSAFRSWHSGRLRRYVLWVCAGLIALVAATWLMLVR